MRALSTSRRCDLTLCLSTTISSAVCSRSWMPQPSSYGPDSKNGNQSKPAPSSPSMRSHDVGKLRRTQAHGDPSPQFRPHIRLDQSLEFACPTPATSLVLDRFIRGYHDSTLQRTTALCLEHKHGVTDYPTRIMSMLEQSGTSFRARLQNEKRLRLIRCSPHRSESSGHVFDKSLNQRPSVAA